MGHSAATYQDNPMPQSNTANATDNHSELRHDWAQQEVEALFELPFMELLYRAHQVHRDNFDPNVIQASSLLNIKTGGCSENCGYCSQSAHHEKKVDLEREQLLDIDTVLTEASKAKEGGASRFCMGAAWRAPRDEQLDAVIEMIHKVKDLGMETCVTLGMLTPVQVERLKEAGLDYYNHNLDTSREFYKEVVTTRSYEDRLDTLANVRAAGINVCAGGILGMGETRSDRAGLLIELANLPEHPQSVPINLLVKVPGTPIGEREDAGLDIFEFIRTIAIARLLMPTSYVRLSAGREGMSDEGQAMCFFAGANSLFYGDRLLTTDNATVNHDKELFERLGISPAA
jgi:biotin synthase